MNILEICLSPGLGGLELYMLRTSIELSNTDNMISVISKKSKLTEHFKKTNISPIFLEKGFKNFPFIRAIKLAKVIDSNDIDVIHMHWAKDLPLISFAKWFSKKKPRLVYTRQMQITRNKDDFYHRFMYKQVDVFITITKVLARLSRKFLSEENKKKIVPLYYGVKAADKVLSSEEMFAYRKEIGFSESDFIVALFGRIEASKGQDVLIKSISKLTQQGHNVKALIVGHAMEDSYLSTMKADVKKSGLEQNIKFMGFVDNVQDWMQACDVTLLASKEETFGLVLAEAMHAGVAVIGTNSGGVPEIIDHDKTGFLFNYGDVDNLCEYILEFKNDPKKMQAYAKAGQKKARQLFDINKHYVELRKLLVGD